MSNTAAYIRVSSDKQDVARQRDSITQWSVRSGKTIDLWFEDTHGRNPRDQADKRKGFQKLLKAVVSGIVRCVVIDAQDRFGTRDAYEWGKFVTILRDNGCSLYDASGKELSSDDDAAVLTGTLGALTSQREQKEKAHRNVSGKLQKAKQGEYQGGNPPYGFDVVCFGANGEEKWRSVYVGHYRRWKVYPNGQRERFDGKDNSPRKDPTDSLFLRPTKQSERVKWAKKIFSWYASEAISPYQISVKLNQLNVDPVFGELWDKVKIRQLLRNPVYMGFPTWNKRASGRFVEFVDGKIQPVKRVNGKASGGRSRRNSDYIQPEKPQFGPLVDAKTWNKVQSKIAANRQRPKLPAQTAELWLKAVLVCGHCGQPMRASMGVCRGKKYPSYYCGSYGNHGIENPTRCHCHRVKHDLIEKLVLAYIEKKSPKVAELLNAVEGGQLDAADPLIKAIADAQDQQREVFCEMLVRVGGSSKNLSLRDAYGRWYEKLQPRVEAIIAKKESDLDKMLDDYRDLTGGLRDRAKEKMANLQAEISRLRRELIDWREPFDEMVKELAARQSALQQAKKVITNGAVGREKTEVLLSVIEKITCFFTHSKKKVGQKNNGKSYLDKVEILSVSGDLVSFTDGIRPGQGSQLPCPVAARIRC